MAKTVLVPIAEDIEEIEAVTIIDTLRRAGAEVTVAATGNSKQIRASRGVHLVADVLLAECSDKEYDIIALPGGMPGAEYLRDSEQLISMLRKQKESGRIYAAICASPVVVLQKHGLLSNRATCHPAFHEELGAALIEQRVVTDGNCVTSKAPGTALEFALELIKLLYGPEKAAEVAGPMLAFLPT